MPLERKPQRVYVCSVCGFPEDVYLHGSVVFLLFLFGRKGRFKRAVLQYIATLQTLI